MAFAQAAAWSTPTATAPEERPWPAPPVPVWPSRPGGTWLEPVVSALFDPDPAQPATAPVQPDPTEPQSGTTTPRAVPLDTAATEPAGPLASAGAPFKRNGQLPADKASGRAPVPLAAAPVIYASPGVERLIGGPVPLGETIESAWMAAIHPDDWPAVEAGMQGTLRGEPSALEYRMVGLDGRVRWVRSRTRIRVEGESIRYAYPVTILAARRPAA